MRPLFVFIVLSLLPAFQVAAQDLPPLGAKLRDSVFLDTRRFPLPVGDWTVVATHETRGSKLNMPIHRLIAAELSNGRLARWVSFQTNAAYNVGGWTRDKEVCDRKDVHYGYSDKLYNANNAECWILNHTGSTLGQNASQVWIDFFRWSDSRERPNTSLSLTYHVAKKGDFLKAEYHYNPVMAGFRDTGSAGWRGNPWHADVASKDERKLEYLRQLKTTGEGLFTQLRTILR